MINDDRKQLGSVLRGLRQRVGLSGIEVGQQAGMSQSKVSKLERGALIPKQADLATLLVIYNARPDEQDEITRLAKSIRQESRRSRVILSREGAARVQELWGRAEQQAEVIRAFEPTIINGLLQTPTYARCVFSAGLTDDALEDAITARMRRHKALLDGSRQFVLIQTEGSLRWQASDPTVMAEQLEAIIATSERPNVRVGVIPWTTPVGTFPRHGWWQFDDELVLYGTEIVAGQATAADDIGVFTRLFEELEAVASFGEDARRELARIASEYRLLS